MKGRRNLNRDKNKEGNKQDARTQPTKKKNWNTYGNVGKDYTFGINEPKKGRKSGSYKKNMGVPE